MGISHSELGISHSVLSISHSELSIPHSALRIENSALRIDRSASESSYSVLGSRHYRFEIKNSAPANIKRDRDANDPYFTASISSLYSINSTAANLLFRSKSTACSPFTPHFTSPRRSCYPSARLLPLPIRIFQLKSAGSAYSFSSSLFLPTAATPDHSIFF